MSILSRSPLALPLVAALALSACDRPNPGTSITVNSSDGETLASVDGKSGEVKLDLPGFSGAFTLPKVSLEADNFELNGVHLYPGSKIRNVDVGNGRDKAFTMTFDSPADPATVRDWFRDKMGEADFTLTDQGGALVGRTAEEKPFRVDLSPAGSNRSTGTITLGG
ncbi:MULTISPECIES: hypothetical protein [Sphingomonas]|jgi:hypothetical protein|uniref:Uncharacterized protein n=1 Tax=Sphingomonas zeae TaxID=1646122 RepID=A0A7Y6EH78_9SPHN|nr:MULTISPECIES: hypothetical protein [Sphingomonas]MBB4048020.1 hypothetical protein [Sphingomonas zeae]MDK8184900.1 hypothetical protein [Sphingomonas zeae]MDK8215621.1 hypothetical protein [Sphingomonas sp. UMB7805-LC452B]NUU47076.1 hypothetical protein [Sphingomonas zeae]